jgi:multidrug efflux pump subunit AcrB
LRFSGDAAPGYSTGQAMEELKNIARQLSAGFSLEWAGLSLQEQQASDQVPLLVGLSLVVVLLVLVASYESRTIPFAVLLIVPVGMFGAVATVTIMGMPNDVYFKVGLITIIGLSAKNAILRCRQPTGNQYRLDRWHACGNTARCLVGTGVLCLGSVHGESLANAPRPVHRNNNREG